MRRWLLASLSVATAIAAFAGAGLALRASLPFPEVTGIAPKYRYFAAHRDEFDVLLMGSSRFYFQLIPAQFDAAVHAKTGRPLRTFSAAFAGLWPPESVYLLRQLLALRPRKLRWVIIESVDVVPKLNNPDEPTRREAYWHDARHTWLALRATDVSTRLEPAERPTQRQAHVRLWAQELGNLGRGAEYVDDLLRPGQRKPDKTVTWLNDAGYTLGPETPMAAAPRESFQRKTRELAANFHPTAPPPLQAEVMAALAAEVRAAGAEPIFVITPTPYAWENISAAPAGARLYAFNDPRHFPELFDPELHTDEVHLNRRGAELLTRLLAERFAADLAQP